MAALPAPPAPVPDQAVEEPAGAVEATPPPVVEPEVFFLFCHNEIPLLGEEIILVVIICLFIYFTHSCSDLLDILQVLVRLARTQAHQKAEEYAAALDEVRARWDSLSSPELQRLLLGLLGDPVIAKILRDGVGVEHFFTPFRGDFKGQFYHTQTTPSIQIKNAAICASGVLSVWGEVGVVSPPHLVLPITIEPSKPRLCHDERFLNLWIRDLPFKLDHLADLPRYWDNFFFVFRTLPFGWKASVYIYHNLGLVVSHAARSLGVPLSQYIDPRHVGQLFASPMRSVILPSTQRAEAAAYIVCYILIEAGYFINTNKSQYVPSTVVCFLGFYAILLARRFLFPRINRRSSRTCGKVFCHPPVSVLKRCNASFLLPGGKLYVREVFNVIAQLTRSSKAAAKNSSDNDSVKEILECSRPLNLAIDVHYVPSRDNMADAPSRACSDLDCMLSEQAWN
ncbi:unnamed protein product [Porites lobata]|uniref:Uncharacterized protein n=1 Tax=Porites lobata TaxID=104759 RepID=A0ABN8NZ37_9CNID|nr:unnamed protein product [Porites lobata]